jgi:hypothetical protein
MLSEEQLSLRFMYHAPPDDRTMQFHQEIRGLGRKFAELLIDHCKTGPELEQAILKIEEAVMWANAGVARRGMKE